MAMEISDGSNDRMHGASFSGKEDLASFDSDKERTGSHEIIQDRKEDKATSGEKPKGAADSEEDISSANLIAGANSSPKDVGNSETFSEVAADEGAIDDDNGSVESYDSALERIAVASTGDPASPEGPLSPVFQPAETPQQGALRQLNLWDTGISSIDSSLLENVSLEEFRTRVAQIAQSQGLTPDSEEVEQVLSALVPLVEANESNGVQKDGESESKGHREVSARDENAGADLEEVRPGVFPAIMDDSDQNTEEEMKEISSSLAEANGIGAGNEPDKQDAQSLESSPPNAENNLGNVFNEGVEDIVGSDMTERQSVGNDANCETEPEVIEWDDVNESDVDDVRNSHPPAKGKGSKETEKLGRGDAAYSSRELEVGNDPQSSLKEFEFGGADLMPHNTKSDREDAVGLKSIDQLGVNPVDNQAVAEETFGDAVMDGTRVTDMQETSEGSSGIKPKAEEKLPLNLSDEEVGEGNPGVGDAAEIEKAGDLQGKSPDGTAITDDLQTIGESTEAPHVGVAHDESLECKTPEEQHDRSKHEESLVLETATDSLARTGEPASLVTGPLDVTGLDVESKQRPSNFAEGEVSETENLTPVGSSTSTPSANDSTPSLGAAGPSLPVRPAGLGRSMPPLEHAPRAVQRSSGAPASTRQASTSSEENQASADVSEGNEDAREKLQMIRVKFLRLAHRLGQSAHNVVVAQVLYRLGLAEQLRGGRGSGRSGAFSFERASALAEEQEAAGASDLEFGCTIMVLGKSGVGKSATINSLFDEMKSGTNAYSPATDKVQEIVGSVHGIKLRVIDTPGLLTSFTDQRRNERIMSSVKRFIKKSPPDIVLYFDRLDMQSRDYSDLPLLRTITDTFGSAVWFNAIVVLTHASSAPPDGANGVPVSYEMFVAQRSHVVQQTIRQAAGDMRLMNPVSLVENHAACRRNRVGERVLPNGQVWKPQLLLLCFASKILAEANSLLKLQDSSPAKPFGVRSRVPPLPFLLSSLLQSRIQLKLPDEQVGTDDDESEDDSDDEAESEGEEEYDDLPPFRRLTRDELKLLDKEQRRIYAEELEYREKLFMKKQLKEERARKREMKRRLAALPKESVMYAEESFEEDNASASSVPVPMPDMALPPSFDSDNPTYRYRYLDAANQWLVRPVLETHGWDHDSGYDGLNVEKMFVVSKKIPASISGQVMKDKKEANLQMECAASFKNGEGKVTQAGLDIQTVGKDLVYTLRSETRFDNFKRNKTTCGLSVTLLGDTMAAGMKIEDRLLIGKRVKLVFNGGALTGKGDVAYGGSLEATIRDKDYPIGQFLSTFGLSVMDWHGDLAIGGNLQVQCKFGKTMTIVRGNLNNRRAGQVSIRVSSSEQLQMALIGLIPLLRTFINNRILSSN